MNTTNPMHLLSRFLLLAAIFATTSLSLRVQAADAISIDLIKTKINGQDLFALSMDKATDLLGKPDDILKEEKITRLVYLNKGLEFYFVESNGEPMCTALRLSLTGKELTSGQLKGNVIRFRGSLTKGLDENWKVKRFLEEFGEFKSKDMATDEGAKAEHLKTLALAEKQRKQIEGFLTVSFSDKRRLLGQVEKMVEESAKILHRIEVPELKLLLLYDQNLKFIHTIAIEK